MIKRRDSNKIFTTGEIAEYCHVTQRTVIQWIQEGKIRVFKTPGKHSRIREEDFVEFLKKYNMPIAPDLSSDARKKRILIVDDDVAMAHAIRRALSSGDKFEIDVAFDGFSAGQKFAANKPDMVILDLRMPKVNGFQLCKAIRSGGVNAHIKILMISGIIDEYDEQNEKKMAEVGVNAYMSKPFTNKDLESHVENLFAEQDKEFNEKG